MLTVHGAGMLALFPMAFPATCLGRELYTVFGWWVGLQPYSICFSHNSISSLQLQPAEQYFSLTALQLQPAEHGERRQRLRQQFESS